MLEHGGKLRSAAQHYGIQLDNWLDLSTGINPQSYPIQTINPLCWQRLPEDNDGLEAAATAYYGNDRLLVLPGSQAAIQILPTLFKPAVVAFLAPIYEEHPLAWQRAGHQLRRLPTLQRALAATTPIILLCNPNNPTATTLPREALLEAAAQLNNRGGWLIVDEAFADPEMANGATDFTGLASLAGSAEAPRLIVLRSLGKFFGLAGARVGFILGAAEKLDQLREAIGPWPVAHPSRAVAREALSGVAWQTAARKRLTTSSLRLADCLAPLGEVKRTALFCTLSMAEETATIATSTTNPTSAASNEQQLDALFEHFARRAILTRRFAQHGLLRFGLPGNETEWQRLSTAIDEWGRIN